MLRAQRGHYYRAQGFLIPRVVSANQRPADLESWQRQFRKNAAQRRTSWSGVVFTWLTYQPEGKDAILSAAHEACEVAKDRKHVHLLTSPSPKLALAHRTKEGVSTAAACKKCQSPKGTWKYYGYFTHSNRTPLNEALRIAQQALAPSCSATVPRCYAENMKT